MIYIDMDGTLCDFRKAIKQWFDIDLPHGKPLNKVSEKAEIEISDNITFWELLEKTEWCDALLKEIKEPFAIITKPYSYNATIGKLKWLYDNRVNNHRYIRGIIFCDMFTKKAGLINPLEFDLLIDDNKTEIDDWKLDGMAFQVEKELNITAFKKFMENYRS